MPSFLNTEQTALSLLRYFLHSSFCKVKLNTVFQTRAEHSGAVASLSLLVMHWLIPPSIPLACFAAAARCSLTLSSFSCIIELQISVLFFNSNSLTIISLFKNLISETRFRSEVNGAPVVKSKPKLIIYLYFPY